MHALSSLCTVDSTGVVGRVRFYAICSLLLLMIVLSMGVLSGCQLMTSSEGVGPGIESRFEDLPPLEDILEPVHPDETVYVTLHERFAYPMAVERLEQIRELGEGRIEDDESQMAFANWIGALEGTLIRQEYQIRRLELKLARYRHEAGLIDAGELGVAEDEYAAMLQVFVSFWEGFLLGD